MYKLIILFIHLLYKLMVQQDSDCLTRSLRKKLGCSCTIVKVEEVKPAVKTEEKSTPAPSASCVQYCCTPQFRPMYCELVHEYPEPTTCSIM
ncbi:hypothetical protein C1H46_009006 [Malus baccata]|uniref:Bifunctional inhibitor/plant lipid transfer protein/seed storage helical domain-containing protein n=1 Tax=Malus baccata TaxID=106549 RepID=A0A540N2Y9_MALBA|nr:hypothetical protein C1H46_009006 [Malus baccata]